MTLITSDLSVTVCLLKTAAIIIIILLIIIIIGQRK